MPPVLQSKKKSELQEIANALGISDQGTKDELCNRLKKHLDKNNLEDDPQFSSLYGKRRRASAQPPSSRFAPDNSPSRSKNRVLAIEPIAESTPAKDLRDVSAFLKTSLDETPAKLTPSRVPLPDSPERSIIDHIPRPQDIVKTLKHHEKNVMQNSREALLSLRYLLSNSGNIWSLTALGELLYILSVTLATHSVDVPLSQRSPIPDLTVRYPRWSNFQSNNLWVVLAHWALPTLILPIIFGLFISFHPVTRTGDDKSPIAPLDYLTAAIIRLAAHVIYPYDSIAFAGTHQLDVLGYKWRLLTASLTVAFAFAEAIALAPEVVVRHQSLFDSRPIHNTGVEDGDDD